MAGARELGSGCLLRAAGLSKRFRGLKAIDNYSLALRPGEILGIIGPNGAGKSTVFNILSGHIHPDSGSVGFLGADITRSSPQSIARAGIGRTFQNIRLFSSMSVLGNVLCARQLGRGAGFAATVFGLPSFARREALLRRESMELLALFGLERQAEDPAASLPYGHMRKLEILRALAPGPRVLLLDEPVAGMNESEKEEMLAFVRRIRQEYSLAIVIIEHDMSVVMNLCDRIQVLNCGRLIAEGLPSEIRSDRLVVESYLGKGDDPARA
jgi:branched-chain amino acid transport system ATP-binding protein